MFDGACSLPLEQADEHRDKRCGDEQNSEPGKVICAVLKQLAGIRKEDQSKAKRNRGTDEARCDSAVVGGEHNGTEINRCWVWYRDKPGVKEVDQRHRREGDCCS